MPCNYCETINHMTEIFLEFYCLPRIKPITEKLDCNYIVSGFVACLSVMIFPGIGQHMINIPEIFQMLMVF